MLGTQEVLYSINSDEIFPMNHTRAVGFWGTGKEL